MTLRIVFAVCLGIAVIGLAGADETYDLRHHYQVGQVIVVRDSMVTTLKIVGQQKDIQKLVPGVFRNTSQSEVRYTVLKEKAGVPTYQRAQVISAEELDEEPDKAPERTSSPLVGKVVMVKAPPDGDPYFSDPKGKALDQEEARKWCNGLTVDMTTGVDLSKVRVGDTFKVTGEAARKVFKAGPQTSAFITGELAEVFAHDGHNCARISFKAGLNEVDEENTSDKQTIEFAGEYLFDLDRRLPISIEAKGRTRVESPMTDGGKQTGVLAMEGPVEAKTTYEEVAR